MYMNFDEKMEYYLQLRKYCKNLEKYSEFVTKSNNINNLKQLYKTVKEVSNEFYLDGEICKIYNELKSIVLTTEKTFYNKKFLIKEKNLFDIADVPILSKDSNELELLEYLVYEGRKELLIDCYGINLLSNINGINLNNYTFVNQCPYSSKIVKDLCDDLNIESYIIEIQPGYTKKQYIFNGSRFHFANIIRLDNKYFLIDLTYKQFFDSAATLIEKIGLMNYLPPRLGVYMMMETQRKKLAESIINDGFIELTESTFKTYMDGFTISFRNGLYYENTNDYSYTTNYSTKDYENFLTGQDNQIKHEGRENLGYQKRPLKI